MEPVELARLNRQCQRIAQRLMAGPATNTELAQLALKYTSRISDLRDLGWDIRKQSHDHATGVVVYAWHPPGPLVQPTLFSEARA